MFNMKGSSSWKQSRRLLQQDFSEKCMKATTLSPQPILASPKNTSKESSNEPFNPYSPFDSSMTFTLLIILTFLVFMGFFAVYIRRFSDQETTEARRRRNPYPLPRVVVKNKGLDPSTISALPLLCYSARQGILEDCMICLSEFDEGEMVKLIPSCRHVFHPSCIDAWLESHVSCPLCRCTHLLKKVEGKCGNELGDRSTAEDDDTSVEIVGTSEIRRSFSCSNFGNRIVLYRSASF